MAKKKPTPLPEPSSEPKFPYTTTPGALRKFLKQVPEKPRPSKINPQLLKSWGHGDTNAATIIRVLKRLGLVGGNNEPTDDYEKFMHAQSGPSILGAKIKEVYKPLFNASKEPHKEKDADLKNLFNIHSGGSAATMQFQIQTFKALCENAVFDGVGAGSSAKDGIAGSKDGDPQGERQSGRPAIHIDLHIHLPPDKTSRDYEAMFQDIGRYLMGRTAGGDGD